MTYEVLAVRYGTLRTRKSALYYRYGAYGEPDGDATLDYYFWVLRSDGGTIVVDTGFDPEVGARRGRTCLSPPREALARVGVDPASVERLVITHCHYDHTGNVAAFPNAEIAIAERELAFWRRPVSRNLQFIEHAEPDELELIEQASRDGRVTAIGERAELAPGVTAITVGGHSPGQLMLLVEGEQGNVVLTSDAVHFYEELELSRPFGVIADLEEMYAAYELVRELAQAPRTAIVAGHDPEVATRFPSAGGDAEGLAVRIA